MSKVNKNKGGHSSFLHAKNKFTSFAGTRHGWGWGGVITFTADSTTLQGVIHGRAFGNVLGADREQGG